MKSNAETKIIKTIYKNITDKGEFPKFGSPEMECNKCMFYGIVCQPLPEYVGCYHGWKRGE